ncbi:MAG: NAD(P)-dependent oxidoreductase [Patescibacteria group bacterium]
MKDLGPGKKIIVTGGSGYVGSRVVIELEKRGYPVVVVDKVHPKERGLTFNENVLIRQGDLRDQNFAKEALSDAHTIMHLAANIGSLTYMHEHQAEILQENAAIDAAVYPAVISAGKPCIIYSSSSMVFQRSTVFPYREEDLSRVYLPTNVYGMSKLVGEYFCNAYFTQHKMPFVILRYHNIYGPGEDAKGSTPGDIHVLPALIEKVLSGQYPLELLGGEEATRPFTYVDDAVSATVAIMEKAVSRDPVVMNTDFNVGPSEATKIVDAAKLVWELLGDGRPFQYRVIETEAVTAERREMIAEKLERAIGWRPNVSLQEGILKTAEWIRRRRAGEPTTLLG